MNFCKGFGVVKFWSCKNLGGVFDSEKGVSIMKFLI